MSENILEVKNLTKDYGDFTLDGLNFTIPRGVELDFEGDKLVGKHEHCYVEKKFKGNQRADKK